jgi:hypothetical protein
MYSLEAIIDGGCSHAVDCGVLGAFSASLFYSVLRACGDNPLVTQDGIYCRVQTKSTEIKEVVRWAALYDPTSELRLQYAREAWTARRSGTEIVELG